MQYLSFLVWLIFSIELSRSNHIVTNDKNSFFLHCIFFIHSSVDGYLVYFYILTIVNNVTIKYDCRFLSGVFISFGYIPRSGTARSYGGFIFNYLRNLHTVFYSGCTSLHSHQQCIMVPSFSCPCQYLLLVFFLMIGILTSLR